MYAIQLRNKFPFHSTYLVRRLNKYHFYLWYFNAKTYLVFTESYINYVIVALFV